MVDTQGCTQTASDTWEYARSQTQSQHNPIYTLYKAHHEQQSTRSPWNNLHAKISNKNPYYSILLLLYSVQH